MRFLKAIALAAALLGASPAWAVTYNPATVYANSGGLTTNSGTTDNTSPLYNSVAGGGGATGVACAATCTAAAGTALGSVTASASWSAGGTAISFTAANCTGVVNGMGIWDTTATSGALGPSNGLIGVVASSAFSSTCNLTLMTGGALRASVGSTDTIYLSSVITLSSAASLTAVPGCTSEGSGNYLCDGSQMIYINSATNAQAKNFVIAGLTSCGGSGTCLIALGASATSNAGSPNPTGSITTSTWQIGGSVVLPDTNIEASVLPGMTVSVDNNIACGGATCWTVRSSGAGDTLMGPIYFKPTTTRVKLSTTGNFNVVTATSGSLLNWSNLEFSGANTSTAALMQINSSDTVSNMLFDVATGGAGTTIPCLTISSAYNNVYNNEFSVCDGPAISSTTNNAYGNMIKSNYIHGQINGSGILISGTNPVATIARNLIIGSAAGIDCINFSGAAANSSQNNVVDGNTCANWRTGGLVVASAFMSISYNNNIFYNNNLTSGANVSWPVTATGAPADTSVTAGGNHGCNDFFVTSGTNLTNVVATGGTSGQGKDITTDPLFVSAGSNWTLQSTSPASLTGCFLNPGAYGASTNLSSMGALQDNPARTLNIGIVH